MERLKILITGGTGFIGANLARFFYIKGHDVAIMVRKESNMWRIEDISKELTKCYADITNAADVEASFKNYKPDIVIHTAVYGGYQFENNEQKIFDVNLYGSVNVLKAFESIDGELFINTGSSSEYGLKENLMREDDLPEPYTAYAVSKVAATLYSKYMASKIDHKIVTLRLFSPFGYYEEPHRLILYLLLSALKGQPAKLSNPGNVRDYVFIEDVAEAYELIIRWRQKIKSGDIFNVGTGKETTTKEIIDTVEHISGKPLNVSWNQNELRTGDKARHWAADVSKIYDILNWQPKNSIEAGLKKTYIWLNQNISKYEASENAKFKKYSK